MLCSTLNFNSHVVTSRITFFRLLSTSKILKSDNAVNERDYIFFKPEVQTLLKKLTGLDINKVFRRRALGETPQPPEYKFMTTAQIQKEMEKTLKKAEKKLQMPPVVPISEDKPKVITKDPALAGYDPDDAKYIFTDINFPANDRARLIVVREPDGTLREANKDERHRMNQLYFPVKGRSLYHPRMFQPENLKPVLERRDYEFILDRACIQFEPDSIEYHNTVSVTYDHIDETRSYEVLRSTRHFGPFVLHLVKKREIDNLLEENFRSDRLEDAASLIQLYHIVHPDCKSASTKYTPGREIEFIQAYIDNDSNKKSFLQAALDSVEDIQKVDSG
ncbi:small ribosomal subunit protein mS22 [Bemisia tabaci]|uniref:small ribosomal subunit protein mS22 n=1 Tax=Bemisia tabaci TaxID=7038 RepID=UPI003B27E2C5